MSDFDPIAWSAKEIEKHGNALVPLMNDAWRGTADRPQNMADYRILHAAIGQLAQVLRCLQTLVPPHIEDEKAKAWGEGNIRAHTTGGGGPDNPYDGMSGY